MQENHEAIANTLKEMLGEAMFLGMSVAERGFSGNLFDEQHRSIISDIASLAQSTSKFLSASGIENIQSQDVVPLYKEIVTQLPFRRN